MLSRVSRHLQKIVAFRDWTIGEAEAPTPITRPPLHGANGIQG
jgi:hypothetical protein